MPPERIPRLGLGTSEMDDPASRREPVATALEIGYRHVDTAQVYGNEEYVGRGIDDAGIPREELFLATKTVHHDVPGPTADDIREAVEGCLDRLGVEFVDLLYVHWPTGVYDPEVTLPVYEELREAGRTRHIGLSNFEPDQLDAAREILDAPILAHQVELHPFLQQDRLIEYAQEHDHWLVAYSPLAKGDVLEDPTITDIAAKHEASPAQVSLAWLLSKDNVAAIPKATSEAHLRENWAARNLELDPEDVERIESIEREQRIIDPENAPWNR